MSSPLVSCRQDGAVATLAGVRKSNFLDEA